MTLSRDEKKATLAVGHRRYAEIKGEKARSRFLARFAPSQASPASTPCPCAASAPTTATNSTSKTTTPTSGKITATPCAASSATDATTRPPSRANGSPPNRCSATCSAPRSSSWGNTARARVGSRFSRGRPRPQRSVFWQARTFPRRARNASARCFANTTLFRCASGLMGRRRPWRVYWPRRLGALRPFFCCTPAALKCYTAHLYHAT